MTRPITKAIVPAAGLGTRLLPATKSRSPAQATRTVTVTDRFKGARFGSTSVDSVTAVSPVSAIGGKDDARMKKMSKKETAYTNEIRFVIGLLRSLSNHTSRMEKSSRNILKLYGLNHVDSG